MPKDKVTVEFLKDYEGCLSLASFPSAEDALKSFYLQYFLSKYSDMVTNEHKLALLKNIIYNPMISDEEALILFKDLNIDIKNNLDVVGDKLAFSLLYSSIAYNKNKLAMLLISLGANPFSGFKIIYLKDLMNLGLTKDKEEKYAKCHSPFELLMAINAPDVMLKSLLNKHLANIHDMMDIAFLPIKELVGKHLLQPEHVNVLEKKVLLAIERLHNIDEETKARLKSFLLDGRSLAIENYPLLNRISVLAELILYIEKPYKQDQMEHQLCGACAFITEVTRNSPNTLVHMVLSLLEQGEAHYPLHLKVNDDIRQHVKHINLLVYQSLKNADSIVNDTYNPNSTFTITTDLTPPEQLTGWMQQISCSEIQDCTKIKQLLAKVWYPLASKLYPRGIHNNATISDLDFMQQFNLMQEQINKQGYLNILLTSSEMIAKYYYTVVETTSYALEAAISDEKLGQSFSRLIGIPFDHYVVVDGLSLNHNDQSLVDISILTFGANFKFTIPLEELKNNWRGMVSAKMPENLLHISMEDIMQKEQMALRSSQSFKPSS